MSWGPGSVELRCCWLCLELSPSQTLQALEESWKEMQFQNIKIFDFNTRGRGLWSLLRLSGRACCACSCSGWCESSEKQIQKVCYDVWGSYIFWTAPDLETSLVQVHFLSLSLSLWPPLKKRNFLERKPWKFYLFSAFVGVERETVSIDRSSEALPIA